MRFLFAWEMGHNYGHVSQIAAVAAELARKRGTEIWLALKSPAAGVVFAKDFRGRLLQAPYHPLSPGRKFPPPLTYAEGLQPCGYDSAAHLHPLIESWRSLFDLVKPDALVVQAAPTALLAARGAKFKTFAFGKGYDMPPLAAPMPPLPYWERNDNNAIAAREQKITGVVNEALRMAKLKPVKKFCEILETDKNFLCTFEELDHYPQRGQASYHGPLYETVTGEKMEWRKNAAVRIFAYLRPGTQLFAAAAEALRSLPQDHDVILAAPGLPESACKKLESPGLRVVAKAVKLDGLLKKCDLAVHHGGGGLASALIPAGVPALILPRHIEQIMAARAAGRTGIALALVGNVKPADVSRKIGQLLSEKKFRDAAQALTKKYKDFTPAVAAKSLASDIAAAAQGKRR